MLFPFIMSVPKSNAFLFRRASIISANSVIPKLFFLAIESMMSQKLFISFSPVLLPVVSSSQNSSQMSSTLTRPLTKSGITSSYSLALMPSKHISIIHNSPWSSCTIFSGGSLSANLYLFRYLRYLSSFYSFCLIAYSYYPLCFISFFMRLYLFLPVSTTVSSDPTSFLTIISFKVFAVIECLACIF